MVSLWIYGENTERWEWILIAFALETDYRRRRRGHRVVTKSTKPLCTIIYHYVSISMAVECHSVQKISSLPIVKKRGRKFC